MSWLWFSRTREGSTFLLACQVTISWYIFTRNYFFNFAHTWAANSRGIFEGGREKMDLVRSEFHLESCTGKSMWWWGLICICQLWATFGQGKEGGIETEAQTGDILLHSLFLGRTKSRLATIGSFNNTRNRKEGSRYSVLETRDSPAPLTISYSNSVNHALQLLFSPSCSIWSWFWSLTCLDAYLILPHPPAASPPFSPPFLLSSEMLSTPHWLSLSLGWNAWL